MPYKEKEIEKMYFPIGEVSKMLDVSPSLLRFWENEFDILKPKKNKKGNRLFTKEDISNLKLIYSLVKEQGYTLKGAKEYLTKGDSNDINKDEIIERLIAIKATLKAIQQVL